MTRQKIVGLALAVGIVSLPGLPAWAGQERTSNGNTTGSAAPRGGGESSGSATSSGGSSSSGSSSSGNSGYSGGSSMGSSPTPSVWTGAEAPMRANDAPSRASDQGGRTRSGSSTGTATTRGGDSSSSSRGGNSSSGGSNSSAGTRSNASSGDNSAPPRRAVPEHSRPRDGRPATGTAVVRGSVPSAGGGGNPVIIYPYSPWGFWGPTYGYALGYMFYDPFAYGGYGYGWGDPYGGYYGGGYGGSGGYAVSQSYRDQGSLRLKIDPKQAKVYIDGAYVGEVNSFDGAFQKLSLDAGSHKVELKADGYAPSEFEVMITPGETVTFKGDLKRIQ